MEANDFPQRFLYIVYVYDCPEEEGHEGQASGEKESCCDSVGHSGYMSFDPIVKAFVGNLFVKYILQSL